VTNKLEVFTESDTLNDNWPDSYECLGNDTTVKLVFCYCVVRSEIEIDSKDNTSLDLYVTELTFVLIEKVDFCTYFTCRGPA